MNNEEAMNKLKTAGNIFEIYHITSFRGLRRTKEDNDQKVIVNILDMGEAAGGLRYFCEVRAENGKVITGNPASDVDIAIDLVHWQELD